MYRITYYILLSCFWSSLMQAYEWSTPHTTYLYAPGLWTSEHSAAKYCKKYCASTGQRIISTHGFELINGTFTKACNFSEISLTKINDLEKAYSSWWPSALIKRLVYTVGKSILHTSNDRYNISIQGSPQGVTLDPYTLALTALNFGQFHDVAIVSQEYDRLIHEYTDKDVVLFGPSRGAAALVNFIALEYAKNPIKRVKAIVLESCFDCLEKLTMFSYPISLLTAYQYKGISPVHPLIMKLFVTVCNAYDIPVLCSTSLKDQRVPAQNTYNFCDKLRDAGLQSLYCLTLKNSTHSAYLKDDPEDARVYQAVVHAFYKKYGLSHDTELAHEGQILLDAAKLS